MKRVSAAVGALAIAAVLVVAFAAPTPANGQLGERDTVQGSGTIGVSLLDQWSPFAGIFNLIASVEIDASSDPSGGNAQGTAAFGMCALPFCPGQPPDSITKPVSCVAVSGNRAIVGADVGLVSGPFFSLGPGLLLYVVDNGTFSAPEQRFDQVAFDLIPAVPSTCPDPTSEFVIGTSVAIPGDDFEINDALPFPTSKEQCENGGWRNFPGFKNQGDCISYVATGGKNSPAGT